MHYIIDGYNLLFKTGEKIHPLQNSRQNIIDILGDLAENLKFHLSIVFDSSIEESSLFPSSYQKSGLEVIYSPRGSSADDYIVELLTVTKTVKNTTVITSDRELSMKCKQEGAKTLKIEDFFDLLIKRQRALKNKTKEHKPEYQETESNFNRLLKIFENRFNSE